MNESKEIISSTLDPRQLICDLLDVDKMTLLSSIFRTLKMTCSNRFKISQSKISVEKTTIVAIPNMF